MIRKIQQSLLLLLLLVASGGGIFLYHEHHSVEQTLRRDFEAKKEQLQQEADAQRRRAEELKRIVQNLETEKRIAEIIVTAQSESPGNPQTKLLFVEYGKDGNAIAPSREYTIDGKEAHIDAMVVKFDRGYVEADDALRGHSIALFTRLYGRHQSPADAYAIDEPGKIPPIYKDADPALESLQKELWGNFWKLADDPVYRRKMGVRVAQGEGVWREFEPGYLYTLSIESGGGLNIAREKMKAIYEQALKNIPGPTTTP